MENPLKALQRHGQSVWLDYMKRSLIESGELAQLVERDGLRGVTSNPSIFEKAIAGSDEYRDVLEAAESRALDSKALYERIAVRDIQDAADVLRPVYGDTRMRDGYVSLEVAPELAHDTRGTIAEAQRLWKTLARPNVMIKVPATQSGLAAIRELTAEGINVNVTLLFAQHAYERVAKAYLDGLEQRAAEGHSLDHVASVASFFVSRIDTAVDARIAAQLEKETKPKIRALLESLKGKIAIANAKLAYQLYRELFDGPRWRTLAERGAQTQRLLWASTSTKDPSFRDVRYVEELIGPDTVNTLPPATLEAFRDHGQPRDSLAEDVDGAVDTMAALAEAGLSMKEITDELLEQGVRLFADAFDKLRAAVGQHSASAGSEQAARPTAKARR